MVSTDKKINVATGSVPHLAFLDGLRALAAMYVVLHHAKLQAGFNPDSVAWPVRIFAGLFNFGHYAVTLFIVLSGFCLTLQLLSTSFLACCCLHRGLSKICVIVSYMVVHLHAAAA